MSRPWRAQFRARVTALVRLGKPQRQALDLGVRPIGWRRIQAGLDS